jgi:predicted aspartyl protease
MKGSWPIILGVLCCVACTRPPAPSTPLLPDELLEALRQGEFPRAANVAQRLRQAGALSETVVGEAVLAERAHDRALLPDLAQAPDPRARLSIVHALYSIGGLQQAASHLEETCAHGLPAAVQALHCVLQEQAHLARGQELYVSEAGEVSAALLPGAPVPLVTAGIDDHEPAVFIIDTGAAASVLSRSYCDREGIAYSTRVIRTAVDSAGRAVSLYPAVVDRVQIGGLVVRNVPLFVMDFPPQLSIAGIIQPLDTWRSYSVELDGPAQLIRISRTTDLDAWKRSVGQPVYASPLIWVGTNVFVQARVAEQAGWFLLDSGASDNSLTAEFSRRIGKEPDGDLAAESVTAAGRNQDRGRLTAAVSLGGSPARDATFSVRHGSPVDPEVLIPLERAGALGNDWLRGRRVLLAADGRSIQFNDASD